MSDEPRSRELWLLAGQELLRRGGAAAVKLHRLTEELGLTTGSFYHHFGSMGAYLDDLASYYGAEQTHQKIDGIDHTDPLARLRMLDTVSRDDRMYSLDAAMRDWGGSNPIAAEAVHNSDELILRFIERCFDDLGYDEKAAQLRAQLFFSVGVARIRPPWRLPPTVLDDVLAILAP